MKRPGRSFRMIWVFLVFYIMLASGTLVSAGVLMAMRLNLLYVPMPSLPLFITLIFGVGILIGTFLSATAGGRVMAPLTKLGDAMRQVARGDFKVRVESERADEIGELTRNFNTMVEELSSIETLRNDFVANVSHEFKTPLAAITGYATLLQDDTLTDAERREYAGMILQAATQLSGMTTNILTLTRLENQHIAPPKRPFSLDEQLRRAILSLEREWSAQEIDLDLALAPVTALGDEALFLRVWLNLLDNAVKFSPKGAALHVSAERVTAPQGAFRAVVTIRDEGCGMDEKTRQHMFDKFYQGDGAHATRGHGLGLALVQRIVQLHGAEIRVESEKGRGTRVVVEMDAA